MLHEWRYGHGLPKAIRIGYGSAMSKKAYGHDRAPRGAVPATATPLAQRASHPGPIGQRECTAHTTLDLTCTALH